MRLTLQIASAPADAPTIQSVQSFGEEGGTIGRADGCTWVLLHNKVSRQHVIVSFHGGSFFIQDKSQNGVAVNSPGKRIGRDRPYPVKDGDRIFIEPYVIDVMVEAGDAPTSDVFGSFSRDPFEQNPFADSPSPASPSPFDIADAPLHAADGDIVDPLPFFKPLPKPPAPPREVIAPIADQLLGAHYAPPEVVSPPPAIEPDSKSIPANYNPAEDSVRLPPVHPKPGGVAASRSREPWPSEPPASVEPVFPRATIAPPPVSPAIARPQAPPRVVAAQPAVFPPPAAIDPPGAFQAVSTDPTPGGAPDAYAAFAKILAGAGLEGATVTPELMTNFGQILRIVVSGLMDTLQARQRIKEEFRMRVTTFRRADNNPLKFSANVDDALHNLLVKRNPAYLGPMEAFADAFDDLRHHQLAMLVGIRAAFEAMLAEFDPEQLQADFDQQLAKSGSMALMPAKLRYWDMFREKRAQMDKDPEALFIQLFGEAFSRAYEAQFRRLKTERSGGPDPSLPLSRPSGA